MKKFWTKDIEFKAFVVASMVTILGFLSTLFLFWFNRYDIPLAILLSGSIISLSWFFLYVNKRRAKPKISLDLVLTYIRLFLVFLLAILFTFLEISYSLVIISPIYLVVSYLFISLSTLLAYIGKEKDV